MAGFQQLNDEAKKSGLYSEELAPIPPEKRTWNKWNLASIWVGMAVCIPTYLLASYMISTGVPWAQALLIIGLANLIIAMPMVLNGHAGVKYGLPFPVLGRAAFGTRGVHFPAIVRALVACGWFGVQTWIGGSAIYVIGCQFMGVPVSLDLVPGKFIGFGVFWLINVYFIWKGTESIKRLEAWAAPLLVLIGFGLIFWAFSSTGEFKSILQESKQLQSPSVFLEADSNEVYLNFNPLKNIKGYTLADQYRLEIKRNNTLLASSEWQNLQPDLLALGIGGSYGDSIKQQVITGAVSVEVQYRRTGVKSSLDNDRDEQSFGDNDDQTFPLPMEVRAQIVQETTYESSWVQAAFPASPKSPLWLFILNLTAMVGFWATMSISISDITRYAKTQKDQIIGQFVGLPPAMVLYSFVGIFVTAASFWIFPGIFIQEDAPWDPVILLSEFDSALIVVLAQVCLLIATLSTNIAANVIAPAFAFSNLDPRRIDFKWGGIIAAVVGILIMPWLILNQIASFLVFVSGFLGPVLGIMLADYFVVRKTELQVNELFLHDGIYSYQGGINYRALAALGLGVFSALLGLLQPSLAWLYDMSWFTGFAISFLTYILLMRR
jgi:cytosine/uracil/thiamine/allantoin permease